MRSTISPIKKMKVARMMNMFAPPLSNAVPMNSNIAFFLLYSTIAKDSNKKTACIEPQVMRPFLHSMGYHCQ
jgi:hypothetical protein